jgi:hypothetical protein
VDVAAAVVAMKKNVVDVAVAEVAMKKDEADKENDVKTTVIHEDAAKKAQAQALKKA